MNKEQIRALIKQKMAADSASYLSDILKTIDEIDSAVKAKDKQRAQELVGSLEYILMDFSDLEESRMGRALRDYIDELQL